DFLVKKKAAKDARQQLVADALDEADTLYGTLERLADDSRRRTPAVEGPTSRMVLDAAYLVRRRGARGFQAAGAQAARPLEARGLTLTLTARGRPITSWRTNRECARAPPCRGAVRRRRCDAARPRGQHPDQGRRDRCGDRARAGRRRSGVREIVRAR